MGKETMRWKFYKELEVGRIKMTHAESKEKVLKDKRKYEGKGEGELNMQILRDNFK